VGTFPKWRQKNTKPKPHPFTGNQYVTNEVSENSSESMSCFVNVKVMFSTIFFTIYCISSIFSYEFNIGIFGTNIIKLFHYLFVFICNNL